MRGRAIAAIVVAATAGLVAFVFVQFGSVEDGGVGVGVNTAQASCSEPSPDCFPKFDLVNTEGLAFTPPDLEGKIVVVNFWATWCKPCQAEIPDLAAVYKRHKDDGVVILGVLRDDPSQELLETFSTRYGLTYPVVRTDNEIEKAFGSPEALPTTFVYGRDGHLRESRRGSLTEAELESMLRPLLGSGR